MAKTSQLQQKFQQLTSREQGLILMVGIVAIVMLSYTLMLDPLWQNISKLNQQNKEISLKNNDTATMIAELQQHLADDPNAELKQTIADQKQQLANLEQALLSLTAELIDPVEMRQALSQWLKLNAGVKLKAFEVLAPEPIQLVVESQQNMETEQHQKAKQNEVQLYQHGIKLTLSGSYFKIRDYLQYVEQSQWKIFWKQLDYKSIRYPQSEAVIELYALSTHKEFIGVQ